MKFLRVRLIYIRARSWRFLTAHGAKRKEKERVILIKHNFPLTKKSHRLATNVCLRTNKNLVNDAIYKWMSRLKVPDKPCSIFPTEKHLLLQTYSDLDWRWLLEYDNSFRENTQSKLLRDLLTREQENMNYLKIDFRQHTSNMACLGTYCSYHLLLLGMFPPLCHTGLDKCFSSFSLLYKILLPTKPKWSLCQDHRWPNKSPLSL